MIFLEIFRIPLNPTLYEIVGLWLCGVYCKTLPFLIQSVIKINLVVYHGLFNEGKLKQVLDVYLRLYLIHFVVS